MKSISLLVLTLTATMTVATAQTTVKPSPSETQDKTSFQKFYDRLKITYLGFLTGPGVGDVKDGHFKYASTSPETETKEFKRDNRDALPTNLYNSFAFNYNFGAKMNFVFIPRITLPLASTANLEGGDQGLITLEDTLVGFQGVIYSSDDKKFNLFVRPGVRLPVSQGSRNSTNRGLGSYTHQVDLLIAPSYTFNDKWELGLAGQIRTWVIDDRYNETRNRLGLFPSLTYTINEVSTITASYEVLLENSRRWESLNDKKPVYEDIWQNAYVGYGRQITEKLNIQPFLSVYVNDTPIDTDSFWVGAYLNYKIK